MTDGATGDARRWLPRRARPWLPRRARRAGRSALPAAAGAHVPAVGAVPPAELDIAPNDPLLAYLVTAPGTVDIDSLELNSPALEALRAEGTHLVVPLVSQGELIGVLRLGPRRSEQDYSYDDRRLLENLATHAAPAIRLAQMVRQQQAELRRRERIEQELRVAQLIQQQFLPRELPDLPGWRIAAYYQPARAVGGDFYDFIELPDGQTGIVVGDVADKGVPAALVMATTHSVLRAAAPGRDSPGEVLAHANDLLVREMPEYMFVTCLYAILDPPTGRLRFANAGHNLPYLHTGDRVAELRATGMPLGLLPGTEYEEREIVLGPGDRLLLHSDGLAEAHGADRQMFGFPRLAELCGEPGDGKFLIDRLLTELAGFTGPGWEQEDDITLVTLQRVPDTGTARIVDEFQLPSRRDVERAAVERVTAVVADLGVLSSDRLERLGTAVAEAVMNAAEHGNRHQEQLPVTVRVSIVDAGVEVAVTDEGGDRPVSQAPEPDLAAKLAGEQSPRGWGLFLIRNMVDELHTCDDGTQHTVRLVMLGNSEAGREQEAGNGHQ
jgi:serine phosphatase RsbU (regulator of sigma subunit)/anti-sigma regulatory factor (Ser/Thr protein kinase)